MPRHRMDSGPPRLVRVCFDTPAPIRWVWRLIRGAEPLGESAVALGSADFRQGQYCLVDALIDERTRAATIFQVSPSQRLFLGGVYPARSLDGEGGRAYLEFLRNPKPASSLQTTPVARGGASIDGCGRQRMDAALALLLLNDGAMLRSATLHDLTHLTAEQNYVRVHLANGDNVVVRGPLQKFASLLPEEFVRISRNMIINLGKVQRLRRLSRDLGVVTFDGCDGERNVRLGRRASIIVRTALLVRSGLQLSRRARTEVQPKEAMSA